MMSHVAASGDYALHEREVPPKYNNALGTDYYGGDYLPSHQLQADPATFHTPPHEDASGLVDAFAGIDIALSSRGKPANKELVVHAIEAAASVLRDQASALQEQIAENERLRSALRVREWELQNYQRMDERLGTRHAEHPSQEDLQAAASVQQLGLGMPERSSLLEGPNPITLNRDIWVGNGVLGDPQSSLIIHPNAQSLSENLYRYSLHGTQGQHYGSNFGANGILMPRNLPDAGFAYTSSPINRPMSPMRPGREGDSDLRIQAGGLGSSQPGQELVKSTPGPQDEIKHLKKVLQDCTLKELQLVHENHILEQRISELRLTIEKYQQELVDTRENSIPHDLLEENARLTSELRAAAQDVNFYASSLMALLVEFNLPATRDPHSIVSGIKTLIQHLREETRKDGFPPKQPWRSPQTYQAHQHGVLSSPVHSRAWAPKSPEPHGLEIVPQQTYLRPDQPLSPATFFPQNSNDWDGENVGNPHHTDNYTSENIRHPPYSGQAGETQHVSFRGIPSDNSDSGAVQRNDSYIHAEGDSNGAGHPYGPEYSERAERMSPPLPPLPEEPPSSLSDDEDPLPDIDGLTINGEAVLGSKILACGISINGTTLCHFQWVRHHWDGSLTHIPGAAQPEYTITADDVDALLSLECTPMDDRNRKGEMVRVFVNNHNRIARDADMNDQILEYLDNGHASFEVKMLVASAQDVSFEPAVLFLKRSLYELKRSNGKRVIGSDRYVSDSAVEVKVGKDAQCAIITTTGIMHSLDCNDNRMRDLLVLTMREFIKAAMERKRGKKRLWLK